MTQLRDTARGYCTENIHIKGELQRNTEEGDSKLSHKECTLRSKRTQQDDTTKDRAIGHSKGRSKMT